MTNTPFPKHIEGTPPALQSCRTSILRKIGMELWKQQGMAVPLIAMNLTWFAKLSITTMFLGKLGELQLAGGALGFTFANVTGFSVLAGLAGAMEPICGQAYGAKNYKLLHKTLVMATILLLLVTLPISFLWLNVDKILGHFGQQRDMAAMAKRYLFYLLPDLIITSFLCPLKAYLSAQGITIPILFSSTIAVAFHVPINMILSKSMGVAGVAMAVWLSDLIMTLVLLISVLIIEIKENVKWRQGGWWDQSVKDWSILLKLCGPCCLTTCLEWWCYEILVLLTGRLPNAREAVSVMVIVLNFDYLLFSVMVSLSVSASTRVSNELGANRARAASWSAYVSLGTAAIAGCLGAVIMVASRGWWGPMFSHNKGVIRGVKKMMVLMALLELANFPLTVCGGIVRGTARPWLSSYASLGGFYLLALPVGIVLGFKARLGLEGLLMGFMAGVTLCLFILLVFVVRTNWVEEAAKAQILASDGCVVKEDGQHLTSERKENVMI
ncbi:protein DETOXIFICATION 56 [Silene latifolia]|uniref:protein DETOXIFICATION 56 n=1 Tax=Silene latifolia TaxID=37657 RepID=UPI003D7741E5